MQTEDVKLDVKKNLREDFNAMCNAIHISKHLVAYAKSLRASLFVVD
jgi:hypothetical protein